MKPKLLKVETGPTYSFSVRRDQVPHINNKWHYHSELELIHFQKGSGTQFIGDNINNFKMGDVVLLGSNLPHYWRFDTGYFKSPETNVADIRVVHFSENFWGDSFLNLPENAKLKSLFEKSRLGLLISGSTKVAIAQILDELLYSEGTKRLILLLEAINLIAETEHYKQISSRGFNYHFEEEENDRINSVYNFTINNFRRKIALEEVAEIADLSKNSFCRYFKSRTGKTFSRFVIELRIGNACKLLIENKMNIKEICLASGFYNFTSFHKNFKEITNTSPLIFQKEYLRKHQSKQLLS